MGGPCALPTNTVDRASLKDGGDLLPVRTLGKRPGKEMAKAVKFDFTPHPEHPSMPSNGVSFGKPEDTVGSEVPKTS
jgi:hypothetical protein